MSRSGLITSGHDSELRSVASSAGASSDFSAHGATDCNAHSSAPVAAPVESAKLVKWAATDNNPKRASLLPIVAPTESNAKKVPQTGPAVSGTGGGGKGGKGAAGPQGFVERVQQLRRWFTTYRQLFALSLAVNVVLVCLAATGNFAWGRNNAGTLSTCFLLLLC